MMDIGGKMDNSMMIAEAMRRRLGQQPSGAGLQAQSGAAPSGVGNPIQQQGMNRMQTAASPGQQPQGMFGSLQQAKPGEGELIVKALIRRLQDLGAK